MRTAVASAGFVENSFFLFSLYLAAARAIVHLCPPRFLNLSLIVNNDDVVYLRVTHIQVGDIVLSKLWWDSNFNIYYEMILTYSTICS